MRSRARLRSFLARTCSLLLTLALVAAALAFVAVAVVPRLFGVELRSVVSGSMEPSVPKGALAVSVPSSPDGLRAGDVIMFRRPDEPGSVVVHRIESVEGTDSARAFRTRGDANGSADPWTVTETQVLGRVVFDVPRAGRAVEALRTRAGFAAMMAVPAALIVLAEAPLWYRLARGRLRGAPGSSGRQPAGEHVPRVAVALGAVAVALGGVALTALLTAPEPAATFSERRARDEAAAVAGYTAMLATGEAFDADVAILALAADPALADPADGDAHLAALRAARDAAGAPFGVLVIVGRDGAVLSSTDPALADVHESAAFLLAHAHDALAAAPAASSAGAAVFDFATPLRDAEGAVWAVLLGRAEPARLWPRTLGPGVDGSETTIVDGAGRAVTEASVASDWICGESPIGAGTHLDHGWRVRACLPPAVLAPRADVHRFTAAVGASATIAWALCMLAFATIFGRAAVRPAPARVSAANDALEARLHSISLKEAVE